MPIRLPKATCEQWLAKCSEEQQFVCINGLRVKDLHNFVKLFEKISDDDYRYHVTKEKNDFANWVEGVFHNGHLAASLRSARSRKEAYQYVKRHELMLLRNIRDAKLKLAKRLEKKNKSV